MRGKVLPCCSIVAAFLCRVVEHSAVSVVSGNLVKCDEGKGGVTAALLFDSCDFFFEGLLSIL